MKKTLYILRHAKAAAGLAGQEDHDRPLTARGLSDARALGKYLKDKNEISPSVRCLSSTSRRTRETYAALCEGLGSPPPVTWMEGLYHASAGEIFAAIAAAGGKAEQLLVIGHNPGMHEFCLRLAGAGNPEMLVEMRFKFPTCALAVFEVDAPWDALFPGGGRLTAFHVSASLLD